jgi:hypothetical protein
MFLASRNSACIHLVSSPESRCVIHVPAGAPPVNQSACEYRPLSLRLPGPLPEAESADPLADQVRVTHLGVLAQRGRLWFGTIERQAIHRGTFSFVRDLMIKIRQLITGCSEPPPPLHGDQARQPGPGQDQDAIGLHVW